MKIFKHRNMMGCIFALMLSLPLLGVLARSAYVIVNKNAYQSYSEKVNTTTNIIGDGVTIRTGLIYQLAWNGKSDNFSVTEQTILVLDGQSNIRETIWPNETWTLKSFNFTYEGTRARLICYDTSNNQHNYFNYFNTYGNTSMYFVPQNDYTFNSNSSQYINYYLTTYNTGNLDNVFEYSLDKVIENNNFGNINFLEWFEDMFLSENQVNNRYVHYFNWYLNYTMFVSCAYILFLCLIWFVNFSRRLLERGMNYDW